MLRDAGLAKVAVLDIDYHHGNGTQAIFYERADVFFASVHGDPHTEYPYYLGYADERGSGAGAGYNLNLPLPRGTGFNALARSAAPGAAGHRHLRRGSAGGLARGGHLRRRPDRGLHARERGLPAVGEDLAAAGLPTLFVFEGGYAVAQVGVNAANVLEGFAQRARAERGSP